MAQCVATTQHDNRGRGGQRCTRHAIRGSEYCFAHGGVQKSSTPEKIGTRVENPGEPCSARNHKTGEPCGNYAIKGSTVCLHHGGAAGHTRQAAAQRMIEMRLKAIGVVDGMLDDPSLEPTIRLRAAQIVLDRTGLGPASKIEHEHEVKPYERLIKDATVVRDVALPPGESDEVIDAEIEEEPTPTEPAKDWHLGKPTWDPNRKYIEPEPEPEPEENHVVVAFPRPPQRF